MFQHREIHVSNLTIKVTNTRNPCAILTNPTSIGCNLAKLQPIESHEATLTNQTIEPTFGNTNDYSNKKLSVKQFLCGSVWALPQRQYLALKLKWGMYGWRRELPAAMSNMECADAPQSLHHARPTNTHCKSSQIHTTSNKKYRVQEYTNTFLSTRINLYTCLYHYKSLHTAIHCSHTQYLSTKLGPEKSSLKLCNVSTLQCAGR